MPRTKQRQDLTTSTGVPTATATTPPTPGAAVAVGLPGGGGDPPDLTALRALAASHRLRWCDLKVCLGVLEQVPQEDGSCRDEDCGEDLWSDPNEDYISCETCHTEYHREHFL